MLFLFNYFKLLCIKATKDNQHKYTVFVYTQRMYNSLHISNTTDSRRERDNLINTQTITNINYKIINLLYQQQHLNNYQTKVHVIDMFTGIITKYFVNFNDAN